MGRQRLYCRDRNGSRAFVDTCFAQVHPGISTEVSTTYDGIIRLKPVLEFARGGKKQSRKTPLQKCRLCPAIFAGDVRRKARHLLPSSDVLPPGFFFRLEGLSWRRALPQCKGLAQRDSGRAWSSRGCEVEGLAGSEARLGSVVLMRLWRTADSCSTGGSPTKAHREAGEQAGDAA